MQPMKEAVLIMLVLSVIILIGFVAIKFIEIFTPTVTNQAFSEWYESQVPEQKEEKKICL